MFKTAYFADQRLEIVILGPMRGEENDSSIQIRNALKEILQDKNCRGYLDKYGVPEDNVSITFPEEWRGPA